MRKPRVERLKRLFLQARLRFAAGLATDAFADFFFDALTALRLFFSASIRLTTFGGASTCGRDDLFAGDLLVDDALQPFAILVLVVGQIQRPFEGGDDLFRQLDLFGLHLGRHRAQLLDRVDAADFSAAWCSVCITMPRSCGRTATRYSRP